ncbi:unnamed protein product [Cochlearia groenlandica]
MALQLALGVCVYLLFTQVAKGFSDEFDCVDIYKQLALQHPLLKNHKIQEIFSSHENLEESNKKESEEYDCPKGTVAISRQRNGSDSFHLKTDDLFGNHYATIETVLDGSIYRGADAEMSLHSLNLQDFQVSESQIWLENGPSGQLNSIQAGWAVLPRVYGDSVTRFTIHWTRDGYERTGCYNTDCPGFVVVSRNHRLGSGFWGSSVYGKTSLLIRTQIFQDGMSGNWGLKLGDEVIGYWPSQLFTHLNDGASLVRFGGNTFMSPAGISPPMGNGHFPDPDLKKSAHFRNIVLINNQYKRVYVLDKQIRVYADDYSCFNVKYWGFRQSVGVAFSYGGPGGNCGF